MTTPKKEQLGLSSNADSVIHRLTENRSLFEAFLRRRVEDDFLVQDLLQQSLVKAIQEQHSLNNEESVVPWFYRILRNTVIDYYRAKASEKARRNDYLVEAQVLADNHVPSLDEVKATVCRCLDDARSVLRPGYSDLALAFLFGYLLTIKPLLQNGLALRPALALPSRPTRYL